MSAKHNETDIRVKNKIIGIKQFLMAYFGMMFLVGIQVGILIFPGFSELHSIIQVHIILIYWALVALAFSYMTNVQITRSYDAPMRRLGEAAKKVASGDFSVYAEPSHTPDNYDFIDVMFLDFNKMVQELGSIETLKNDFVSSVSHEIKTPLAVIKNYATMLRSENLQAETKDEYIETITGAAAKLSNLVTDILKLNKLENQEIESASESFNLCRQLSDCVLRFESLLDEKNIEISVSLEDRTLITADESMLEIVWNNLLSNAFKYTGVGGTVSLIQTSDAHSVTVTVTDTGCGMEEETMKHIFDQFYQGDTSHSSEGNGLGLALAYRVVEKLNGTITVTSKVDVGSTFTVMIPIGYHRYSQ